MVNYFPIHFTFASDKMTVGCLDHGVRQMQTADLQPVDYNPNLHLKLTNKQS